MIPLTVDDAFLSCSSDIFEHSTSHEYELSHEIIAQDRAVAAIHMGLGIRKPGYNIYVAGIQGTGKTSVIRSFLETCQAIPRHLQIGYTFMILMTPKYQKQFNWKEETAKNSKNPWKIW